MSALRPKTLAVAGIAAALVAGSTAVADAATTARAGVPVHAVTKHTVAVPAVMHPGRIRFHNTGARPLYVLKKRQAGVGRLVKDLNAATGSIGPGRLVRDFTLYDVIDGGSYVYLSLSRGTYYFADASLEHYSTGAVRTVSVRGTTRNASAPRSRALVVPQTGALTAPATLARNGYVHVENRTGHVQEVLVFGLARSATATQVQAFLAAPTFESLFSLPLNSYRELAILGGHRDLWSQGPHRASRFLIVTIGMGSSTSELPALHKSRVRLLTVR